jgi:hypothetical protein
MHSIAAGVASVKHTHIATVAAQICCSGICFALTGSHEASTRNSYRRRAKSLSSGKGRGELGRPSRWGPIDAI